MRQTHSWYEYQYRFSGDNDNNRMWIRDSDRIHQVSNGNFLAVINNEWFIDSFNSFEEAQAAIDEETNDNTL
jgi:hypothetical protein